MMHNKIRIMRCGVGAPLPPRVHCGRPPVRPGWYVITPTCSDDARYDGVAHGPYRSDAAFLLARAWLWSFRDSPEFWYPKHLAGVGTVG